MIDYPLVDTHNYLVFLSCGNICISEAMDKIQAVFSISVFSEVIN